MVTDQKHRIPTLCVMLCIFEDDRSMRFVRKLISSNCYNVDIRWISKFLKKKIKDFIIWRLLIAVDHKHAKKIVYDELIMISSTLFYTDRYSPWYIWRKRHHDYVFLFSSADQSITYFLVIMHWSCWGE